MTVQSLCRLAAGRITGVRSWLGTLLFTLVGTVCPDSHDHIYDYFVLTIRGYVSMSFEVL
jgi:hypothetical protein